MANIEEHGFEANGKFAKGRKKTGGRQKGQQNYTTKQVKEAIYDIVAGNIDKAKNMLEKLNDPKDFLNAYTRLAEFVVAKQSAVKVNDERQSDLKSELSEMENKEI